MIGTRPLSITTTVAVTQAPSVPATAIDVLDGSVGVLRVSRGRVSYRPSPTIAGPITLPKINFGLGFRSYAVYIDNYTNQPLYVPSAGTFVPAYRTGVVIPLPGSAVAEIRFSAPPGQTAPTAKIGEIVSATFTEDQAGPSGGTGYAP